MKEMVPSMIQGLKDSFSKESSIKCFSDQKVNWLKNKSTNVIMWKTKARLIHFKDDLTCPAKSKVVQSVDFFGTNVTFVLFKENTFSAVSIIAGKRLVKLENFKITFQRVFKESFKYLATFHSQKWKL